MTDREHHIAQYVVTGPSGLLGALSAIKAATTALGGARSDTVPVTIIESGASVQCTVRLRRPEDDTCA